ncbi:PIN domain protein [Capnocytophaga sputigena]|nr:PIN domain protein [Capnocytophaga sputigena]
MTLFDKMKKIICDTNVISRYILNSSTEITITIEEIIGIENIFITPVIYIELMNWLAFYEGIEKTKRMQLKKLINSIPVITLNEDICNFAMKLAFQNPHSKVADTLIGATAIYYNINIYTLNKKDFELIGAPLYSIT